MSALQALKAARDASVRIGIDGDALMLDAEAAPPAAVLELLSRHKAQVIALLGTGSDGWSGEDWRALFDERAAIAEFDGGLPRDQAEARAFACCVAELLNRYPVSSRAGICLGCEGVELPHDPLLPFGGEPSGHAWLHSRCWTAWHTSREAQAVSALSIVGIMRPVRGRDSERPAGVIP